MGLYDCKYILCVYESNASKIKTKYPVDRKHPAHDRHLSSISIAHMINILLIPFFVRHLHVFSSKSRCFVSMVCDRFASHDCCHCRSYQVCPLVVVGHSGLLTNRTLVNVFMSVTVIHIFVCILWQCGNGRRVRGMDFITSTINDRLSRYSNVTNVSSRAL